MSFASRKDNAFKATYSTDRDQPANDQLAIRNWSGGLAYHEAGEGRNTLVCLTEKGRDFSAQKVRPLFQIENKIWSEWTVDEQERYLLFTQKYRDSFKKYLHEDL